MSCSRTEDAKGYTCAQGKTILSTRDESSSMRTSSHFENKRKSIKKNNIVVSLHSNRSKGEDDNEMQIENRNSFIDDLINDLSVYLSVICEHIVHHNSSFQSSLSNHLDSGARAHPAIEKRLDTCRRCFNRRSPCRQQQLVMGERFAFEFNLK